MKPVRLAAFLIAALVALGLAAQPGTDARPAPPAQAATGGCPSLAPC